MSRVYVLTGAHYWDDDSFLLGVYDQITAAQHAVPDAAVWVEVNTGPTNADREWISNAGDAPLWIAQIELDAAPSLLPDQGPQS